MKITLRLTKTLAMLNKEQKEAIIVLEGNCSMAGLITLLDETMPGLKNAVLNQDASIADGINIYVNGENIRSLEGTGTILSDGDRVGVIPAAAAG